MSANGCPTERISSFVDSFLQPLVKTTRSFIKDTTHFLRVLRDIGQLPDDALLVTLDVTSLYTNIPHLEGKTAVERILAPHRDTNTIPTNFSLVLLLDAVLTMNNFEFNGENYLQTGGVAMGTKVAPYLANIFMAHFEETHVYTYHLQPLTWVRFIDDVFQIWTHGRRELDLFIQHLNDCHPTIKFTAEISSQSVNFLDTVVSINEDRNIITSLYCKPTDAHNYLLFSSAHPRHCLKSTPYSQFLRIRRICSLDTDFEENAVMIGRHFMRRGYPAPLVETALIRAYRTSRSDLLRDEAPLDTDDQPGTTEDNFFLISTFIPGFQAL
ncbi:uncharacterized protein LOC135496144 [Lineus longissimus]|uniref:uncharacterized protein LOC135496144 n=1 Tax=Lineus longissimus TaxID=88925 RepID=UPI00315CABDA